MVVHRDDGFVLDVGLTVRAGRTTALLGPNGAGKSTALAALAGLVPITEGRIVIDGEVVDDPATGVFVPAAQRRVGVVFQDGLLFDHLSVRDNVAFGPRAAGTSGADATALADRWLSTLGVADLADRAPPSLSGGQAQRVAIARALVTEPRLVLLDEPMSALDVQGRAGLRRTLAAHLERLDAPRVLVTHDPVEAFLLADDVAVLEDGRITQTGTPDEIRQRPVTPYAADLVGTNLLFGDADDGTVTVDDHPLRIADRRVAGPVVLAVHPHAIVLGPTAPRSSARNVWRTTVTRTEDLGDRHRVTVGAPLPLTAEVTPSAVDELDLVPGATVHVSVKATEIAVTAQR